MRWLRLALAVLGWHSLLAELGAAARAQPALRWPALLLAFALPAAGAAILLRGPDLGTRAGRRLRLWAHLATLAAVIATALRVPQGLPTRPVWLALFGAPLAVSLLLALNTRVVDTARLVYKQPPVGHPPAERPRQAAAAASEGGLALEGC
jgi:asparagine N-glycosylation enzyme membrane subunit Stt3